MIWRQDRKRDAWVEAGVGLAGGLVASWAMGFVHQGWQKLTNGAVEQNRGGSLGGFRVPFPPRTHRG
jgi:hypothetical protein